MSITSVSSAPEPALRFVALASAAEQDAEITLTVQVTSVGGVPEPQLCVLHAASLAEEDGEEVHWESVFALRRTPREQ